MADASGALSAPQLAGTWVNRRGMAKKLVTSVAGREVAGAVGALAAGRMAGRSAGEVIETPDFGRDAYLALSDSSVALVKVRTGLMKLKVTDENHAIMPRSEVSRAELGNGTIACPLTITFANGSKWELDVPRGGKRAARQVVTLLNG